MGDGTWLCRVCRLTCNFAGFRLGGLRFVGYGFGVYLCGVFEF